MINAAFILGSAAFDAIYGRDALAGLAPAGRLLAPPLTAPEVLAAPPAWLGEVDVLFSGWEPPRLDAALLARLPRLRAVFYGAGSIRPLVSDAFWDRGITVTTAAAINALPVVEFTLGAILLSFKRAWHHARHVQAERTYTPLQSLPVPGGYGATIGLVSLGLIGRGVAERLRSFDVRVLAYDPGVTAAQARELGVTLVSLPELFAGADIVSLHAPLLPETRHLIGADLLGRLRPHATFINTARGGLVDESALAACLAARPDVQALLDVTDPEPPAADSPLYRLPNVFLTPHIAGSLGPECRRMGRAMIEEFHRHARGEPLRHAVTREQFARMA
jgi:phosphoglycerate dehydrogenase-like enzyme